MYVELIRFRRKYRLCSRLRLRIEDFNAISLTEPNSRELQLPDSAYCHSTEYNRIQWGVPTSVRLWPFNIRIVVSHPITLLIYVNAL